VSSPCLRKSNQKPDLQLAGSQVRVDLDRFKHKLRDFLIENAFYSVEEYITLDFNEYN
jgi:hypothetical protein